jgi:hypothetical protein
MTIHIIYSAHTLEREFAQISALAEILMRASGHFDLSVGWPPVAPNTGAKLHARCVSKGCEEVVAKAKCGASPSN